MPYRTLPLVNKEFYHIFNRGIARQEIYSSKRDYQRFLLGLSYYRFINIPGKLSKLLQMPKDEREKILIDLETRNEKLVEIIAFSLMPNHFHLLLQQIADNGISTFLRLVSNSYTRFSNAKKERLGPIFQGAFRAVHVTSNEQLLHLSRYIHLNPLVSIVVRDEDFLSYPWSSLKYYQENTSNLVNPKSILEQFKNFRDYSKFILDRADYGKELEKIKHLVLE